MLIKLINNSELLIEGINYIAREVLRANILSAVKKSSFLSCKGLLAL